MEVTYPAQNQLTPQAESSQCLVQQAPIPKSLRKFMRDTVGFVTPASRWLAVTPWTARGHAMMVRKPCKYLPPHLPGLGNLIVAQDNSCRFCFTGQRSLLKVMGLEERQIHQLESDFHASALSSKDVAGLEFIRKVARNNPRPGKAEVEQLIRAGYSRNEILELCFVAASGTFTNRLSTMLALPASRNHVLYTSYPLFSLFRPLILRMWKGSLRPVQYSPAPGSASRPGAKLIEALGDLPAASVLRRVVDEAFESNVISRRTKLLVMAVIAKAIGCSHGQSSAKEALCEEGLCADDVDTILLRLGSDKLDDLERRLVPFARETVRYDVSAIQRSAAEVLKGLSPAQICEAIGIFALGNALCRMTVALECPS